MHGSVRSRPTAVQDPSTGSPRQIATRIETTAGTAREAGQEREPSQAAWNGSPKMSTVGTSYPKSFAQGQTWVALGVRPRDFSTAGFRSRVVHVLMAKLRSFSRARSAPEAGLPSPQAEWRAFVSAESAQRNGLHLGQSGHDPTCK